VIRARARVHDQPVSMPSNSIMPSDDVIATMPEPESEPEQRVERTLHERESLATLAANLAVDFIVIQSRYVSRLLDEASYDVDKLVCAPPLGFRHVLLVHDYADVVLDAAPVYRVIHKPTFKTHLSFLSTLVPYIRGSVVFARVDTSRCRVREYVLCARSLPVDYCGGFTPDDADLSLVDRTALIATYDTESG
jgi:hypothetical protein